MASDRNTSIPGNQIENDSVKQDELDITNVPTDGQILKVNMPNGDFTALDNKPSDLNIVSQSAEDILIFDGTNWVAKGGTEKIFIGEFSRGMTVASGTQAITGLGFKPSYVLFTASVGASNAFTIGFDNGSIRKVLYVVDAIAGNFTGSGARSISLYTASANQQWAIIQSFDSDGFTLSWTKVNSPTGTAFINFTAFR